MELVGSISHTVTVCRPNGWQQQVRCRSTTSCDWGCTWAPLQVVLTGVNRQVLKLAFQATAAMPETKAELQVTSWEKGDANLQDKGEGDLNNLLRRAAIHKCMSTALLTCCMHLTAVWSSTCAIVAMPGLC